MSETCRVAGEVIMISRLLPTLQGRLLLIFDLHVNDSAIEESRPKRMQVAVFG
jgi:hypothetical protein